MPERRRRRRRSSEFLDHCIARYERGDGYGIFAAVEKSTGRFLGWFHLRPGEGAGPDEPELGYRLVRAAWGKGFASEGSIALVDKAFRDLGATKGLRGGHGGHTAHPGG